MTELSPHITIYRHHIYDFEAPVYRHLLETACSSLIRETEVFRFHHDRIRKLIGRKLLQLAWHETGGQGEISNLLQKSQYGKPFLPHWKSFNLSHSGSEIVLAVSDTPIGIDVEQCKPMDYDVFSGQFHASELSHIRLSETPSRAFYNLWTRKEALLKATGQGLTDTMNELNCNQSSIYYQDRCCYFYPVILDDAYVCCLVSPEERPETSLQTVRIEELPGIRSVP